jgi:hypothetical protein
MKQVEGKVDMTGVPEGLAGVVRRAISYDKAARPRSALAFATALMDITNRK